MMLRLSQETSRAGVPVLVHGFSFTALVIIIAVMSRIETRQVRCLHAYLPLGTSTWYVLYKVNYW